MEPYHWVVAASIGTFVGFTELLARYRDTPFKAARSFSGITYLALNGIASVAALVLILALDLDFGIDDSKEETLLWTQVMAAGFGALLVLRTSFVNIRAGDQDVALGPNAFLKVILDAVDRQVDRKRAEARSEAVSQAMRGVVFSDAHEALPTYRLALMQNLQAQEQAEL